MTTEELKMEKFMTEIEDTEYTIPEMGLGAGLNYLIGMSNSGKTLFAYRLAILAGFGLPLMYEPGQTVEVPREPRKVCIVDFEVGIRSASRKMKKIAKGLEVEPSRVSEKVNFTSYLKTNDQLKKLIKDYDFLIIDNLESLAHVWGTSTFEPEIAGYLRELRSEAAREDTTIIVIHHGSKVDNTGNRGIASGAGSMSIQNSANNAWIIRADEKYKTLEHSKAEDEKKEDITLEYIFNKSSIEIKETDGANDIALDKLLEWLDTQEKGIELSKFAIQQKTKIHKSSIDAALNTACVLDDPALEYILPPGKKHGRYKVL